MATLPFSFIVPDDKADEIIEFFVKNQGYSDVILDMNGKSIPNPETRLQAAARMGIDFIKSNYEAYKVRLDSFSARENAIAYVNNISITSG